MKEDHRQIERTAAMWLARRDAGGWSKRRQAALDAWLTEAISHRVAFLRLEAAWNEAARLKTLAAGGTHGRVPARGEWMHSPYFASPIAQSKVMSTELHRAEQPRRLPRWWLLASVAASLLVAAVIAGGLGWHEFTYVDRGVWHTVLGAQQVVHLPDGSTATLGSETELRIAFSRSERNLYLARGEAYFSDAHNSARPFVVHTEGYRVIAVGTRFDVRRDGGKLRVVVTRGLVRLQSARDPGRTAAMLPAGSIAMVDRGDVTVRHVPLDQARERLSWRDGFAIFHGAPLAEAVEEFNRYNARKIVVADPSLDALRVGGKFRLDNSAAFVRLVQDLFPVQAEQRGGRIMLSRRKAVQTSN